jgi:YjjG family noncanonical pyrimidine nucleotidase
MRYTTLLFDLDNTLFDAQTAELLAFDHALKAGGIESPRQYLPTYVEINDALWAAVERQELTPNQVQARRFADLVEAAELDADPGVLADEFVEGMGAFGDLYPGAREVLERLSSVATLALLTNGLGEIQRARIVRLGLQPLFAAIVISGEVGTAKPGSEIFDLTFEALDRPAKRSALMIGDSLSSDIAGGDNYGISTCWYNPHRKPAGPQAGVDHEIVSLDELPELAATGAVSGAGSE